MKPPIYEPKGRAREYGKKAINIYNGCNHGCTYCFAPGILRKTREQFLHVEPRKGIVEATKRQLEREGITGELIHLCFSCDPYPADIDTSDTREIIKLLKESGNHVQILTKGGTRAERDFDLLDSDDWFGVTLTKFDTVWRRENEPNTASSSERYATIKAAKALGIKTWVSFEPVFHPPHVYHYIEYADAIDLFKIGKLNHAPSDINWGEFGRKCEELCKKYGRNYYLKADLRKKMEKNN